MTRLKIANHRKKIIGFVGILALQPGLVSTAIAQNWPEYPIKLVVPYTAGGSADVPARIFARALSSKLGQQVVVENRPGASGAIGATSVFKAEPDGYTLVTLGTGPAVLNKLLQSKNTYDPDKMTPVILTTEIPNVFVVGANHPAKNLKEFIAIAKKKEGGVNIGFGGASGRLTALLFAAKSGIPATMVSYRGTGPLVNNLLGNQIESGFPAFVPQISQLKPLGVTGEERNPLIPDVPTMQEQGIDVIATTWNVILGPPGMLPETVNKLNSAMNEILKDPAIRSDLKKLGARALGGTPERAAKLMADETAKYGPIIESNNLKIN